MCFSLAWLENLFIWIVIVGSLIAILKLLLPWVFSFFGGTGPLLPILNIVIYAIIAIFVIYIIFALISCLIGSGGFHLPALR